MPFGRPKEPEIMDQRNMNVYLPENARELQQTLIHPESEWGAMNMDTVVSNLGPNELYLVRENFELAGHLGILGLKEGSAFFDRNAQIILNTARSKFGFERKMLATQIVQASKDYERQDKRKRRFKG